MQSQNGDQWPPNPAQQPHHLAQYDAADIPTWPPPYPIDTSAAPFDRPHPGLAAQSYLSHLSAPDAQPQLPPAAAPATTTAGPKRQRISRACDKCNQLRTKCDGREPCAHCVEFQQQCTYDRIKKKRGKVPKALLQAQNRAQASNDAPPSAPENQPDTAASIHPASHNAFDYPTTKRARYDEPLLDSASMSVEAHNGVPQVVVNDSDPPSHTSASSHAAGRHGSQSSLPIDRNTTTQANGWHMPTASEDYARWSPGYSSPSVSNDHSRLFNFSLEDLPAAYVENPDPSAYLQGLSVGTKPVPQDPAPSLTLFDQEILKYPILEPLLPYLQGVIPTWLACRLLEDYFSCSPPETYHPRSPYVSNFFHKKSTFLSEEKSARPRSPSLLASMLWVSSRTCDVSYFTSDPTTRPKTCKRLLELTIQLLVINPFFNSSNAPKHSVVDQVHLAEGRSVEDKLEEIKTTTNQLIGIDDVITQIHIATVVSASESKKESIRWWNAAWGLARELQLGRELPSKSEQGNSHSKQVDAENAPTEEEREERRRTWWLLFMMDRHLSLCYNKPMFLVTRECQNLLHPLDDVAFQNGDYSQPRGRGPPILFSGNSLYGFFLPLMSILGDILELQDVRTQPRWGTTPEENVVICTHRGAAIRSQLVDFEYSAQHQQNLSSAMDTRKFTMQDHETEMAVAYSLYISNVLHILIAGKWDPIELLESEDWLCSEDGKVASEHAVKAAEAISIVLELDPDLSFMPYFLGIQLLQGSFLLLVLADRHQTAATRQLIKACEIMVRAHEACVVTLDTEYQRNFRKIMRSALAEVRGRVTEETKMEQQKRRREVLSLYRWTDEGRGIAL